MIAMVLKKAHRSPQGNPNCEVQEQNSVLKKKDFVSIMTFFISSAHLQLRKTIKSYELTNLHFYCLD